MINNKNKKVLKIISSDKLFLKYLFEFMPVILEKIISNNINSGVLYETVNTALFIKTNFIYNFFSNKKFSYTITFVNNKNIWYEEKQTGKLIISLNNIKELYVLTRINKQALLSYIE